MVETTAANLRKHLGDHLNRAEFGGERVIVTRNGRRSAVLISIKDLELLQAIEDRIDVAAAREAIAEAEAEGWLTWSKVIGGRSEL